jgi:hypothetical protein
LRYQSGGFPPFQVCGPTLPRDIAALMIGPLDHMPPFDISDPARIQLSATLRKRD